jgi:hypothetical protein
MSKHVILRFNLLIKNDLWRKTKSWNYLLVRVKNLLFTYLFQGLSKLPVMFLNITLWWYRNIEELKFIMVQDSSEYVNKWMKYAPKTPIFRRVYLPNQYKTYFLIHTKIKTILTLRIRYILNYSLIWW